ncbi:hypothetical protein [Psittacicella hinzii]|uniref:Uncharacterized protein n=1 Tax=Psittacicella hinzii TaxID=2028575 RepID=A0A3A1YBY7_9GAMM|nr:hypothetical protein [Psittacicella hinzii]RIY35071.1 hypothetical protein CKF58_07130 [Psittacicella hinzii]
MGVLSLLGCAPETSHIVVGGQKISTVAIFQGSEQALKQNQAYNQHRLIPTIAGGDLPISNDMIVINSEIGFTNQSKANAISITKSETLADADDNNESLSADSHSSTTNSQSTNYAYGNYGVSNIFATGNGYAVVGDSNNFADSTTTDNSVSDLAKNLAKGKEIISPALNAE